VISGIESRLNEHLPARKFAGSLDPHQADYSPNRLLEISARNNRSGIDREAGPGELRIHASP
jgi:hypothetical protein